MRSAPWHVSACTKPDVAMQDAGSQISIPVTVRSFYEGEQLFVPGVQMWPACSSPMDPLPETAGERLTHGAGSGLHDQCMRLHALIYLGAI